MLFNIHEAKTNFSKLINQALNGEEVIIARGGKPLIHLVPYTEEKTMRQGGQLKGLMQVRDDFDAPLPDELLKLFHEEQK
jgi:prevent-host-death family protein